MVRTNDGLTQWVCTAAAVERLVDGMKRDGISRFKGGWDLSKEPNKLCSDRVTVFRQHTTRE